MAIFHMNAKIISRKTGRSSTASAAYRAGERIYDHRTGETHDYERRAGVEHSEIIMPAGSDWAPSRDELWNAVEAKNKRADAQLAREIEVALPSELSAGQRRELVQEFAQHIADRYGIAADLCIHAPSRGGDQRNHHAHILTTTNRVQGEGFGNKARELDMIANARSSGGPNEIERLRERWAELQNRHLERAGVFLRVDHRSLEAQGVDRPPGVHKGLKVVQMERRGERTDRGDQSRDRQAQVIELAKVRKQIDAERKRTTTPEQVKAIWHHKTSEQFNAVREKAGRIRGKATTSLKVQGQRIEESRQQRPAPPNGLFARLKLAAYERAYAVWDSLRDGLQHRADQLSDRVEKLGQYMRRSGSYEAKTPGERLAERKAAKAHPELAAAYCQVTAQEQREQDQQRQEKQAARQAERGAQKVERMQQRQRRDAMTPEERKQEVLKQFREKVARGREDRGRGR